jgi:hypothetical protein
VQVVLIAPFLMRFRLGARTFGGEVGLRLYTAVREALPEFSAQAAEPESPMLFDHHMSTGGSRISGKKTIGTVEVEGAGRVWIRFDPSGYCHLMQTVEVENRDAMHRRERRLVYALNEHVERWVDTISTAMLESKLVDPAGSDTLDSGMLLWWHRVLVDPPEGEEPAATRVYGVERKVHDNAWLRFGDGFTTLTGIPRRRLPEVLTGVMSATDDWIGLDEANRLISHRLRRLEEVRWKHVGEVDREFTQCLKLGKDLALRDMVRLEDSRYTVNASGVVMDAASVPPWRCSSRPSGTAWISTAPSSRAAATSGATGCCSSSPRSRCSSPSWSGTTSSMSRTTPSARPCGYPSVPPSPC